MKSIQYFALHFDFHYFSFLLNFSGVLSDGVPRLKEFYRNVIFIRDLKSGLQLLRCFGHLMSRISLCYNYLIIGTFKLYRPFLEIEKRVMAHVNEYCGKSIKVLELSEVDATFFDYLKIQFPKLEELQISSSGITETIYDFIEKHPTVKNLNINNTERLFAAINLARITEALPLLTTISIYHSDLHIDRVLQLISICKSLKTIIIYATESEADDHVRIQDYFYNGLRARLPDWRISIHEDRDPFMDLQLKLEKVHTE